MSGLSKWIPGAIFALFMTFSSLVFAEVAYMDVHAHLFGVVGHGNADDYEGAAEKALKTMDELGIRRMLVLPPPFGSERGRAYDAELLLGVIRRYPGKFAVLGGGGTLCPLILEAANKGKLSSDLRQRFEQQAERLAGTGIVGFGELTSEHFSLGPNHPYLSAPADHPLFLLLADIAARHNLPMDIHMEAVEEVADLDSRYRTPPNPSRLTPNIEALERLLRHNRQARIIWAHLGWDNTGQRTVHLTRRLLERNSNLYMSFKIGQDSLPVNKPLGAGKELAAEWRALIEAFPDRFMVGSDQFFVTPRSDRRFPQHPKPVRILLNSLPEELATRVGVENPTRIFPRLAE